MHACRPPPAGGRSEKPTNTRTRTCAWCMGWGRMRADNSASEPSLFCDAIFVCLFPSFSFSFSFFFFFLLFLPPPLFALPFLPRPPVSSIIDRRRRFDDPSVPALVSFDTPLKISRAPPIGKIGTARDKEIRERRKQKKNGRGGERGEEHSSLLCPSA